jgi:hypothetical protein
MNMAIGGRIGDLGLWAGGSRSHVSALPFQVPLASARND